MTRAQLAHAVTQVPQDAVNPLLDVLLRHGLTVDLLVLWVQFVETKKTGSITVHHVAGQMKAYTEQTCGKIGKG